MKLDWKKVAQFGGITGIAILYVCLVGMVEKFDQRDVISEVLAMGRALLVVIGLGMGYVVARQLKQKIGPALVGSLISGLIGGLIAVFLVVIIEPLNMREMFVNASPALIKILTFADILGEESRSTGLILLIGFITILSLLGTAIHFLPNLLRRWVIAGLIAVLLMGMLEELLTVIMARYDLSDAVADFIFGKKGLSNLGTLTVFVIFGGLHVLWVTQSGKVKTGISNLPSPQQRGLNWVFIATGIIFVLILPQIVGSYISQILVLVGLFLLMGLGLNIEIGLAGLLDLGFVGFYAIGAYIVGLFTSPTELGLSSVIAGEPTGASFTVFWATIPLAIGVSALSGVFLGIPVLRMRGDYLAIVTLGLAEIIRILVLSDFLRPVLGGAQGILSIPKPVIAFLDIPIKDPSHFYYLIIIGCAIIGFIAWRLQYARIGRNWMAIREDEDVAQAMGINLIASKLLAFGTGAAFAGLAGAIFAAQVGSIFPHSFQLLISINVVCLVIIGGVGSIPGVVIGALVLVELPELLREFAEFRLLIYGGLLVVMMLVKPEGFWPSEVVRREFNEADEAEPLPTGQTA